MGQTKYFGLSFFDFGDQLDSRINVDKEIDRFVLIDKQLYGLYKIFGNGVIDGWYVRDAGYQDENGISVSVSSGTGIIQMMACQTTEPGYIYNLPPNSTINIYATTSGSTTTDRATHFFYSDSPVDSDSSVLMARVGTGANSILYIDNTIRDEIEFNDVIQNAIDSHKHRGSPSKIDLETETKNQLPGARLEGIDASKITSGHFDIDRIPLINHEDLSNNGMLTHAALDSFVQTLSKSNKELLGEISSVNLLKTIIFLKYLYPTVDENFVNELTIIPGISPDSFIDLESSTANISLSGGCISGKPARTGIYTSVYWNNTYSFNTYNINSNMVIEDDTVSLDRSSQSIDSIADFSDNICFEKEMIVSNDEMSCTVTVEDGNKLAQMGGGASLSYYYRKNFQTFKVWDGIYDELVVKVRTDVQIHDPVYMYVVNGSNINTDGSGTYGSIESENITGQKKPSSSWVLLSEDEYMGELTEKVFDISALGLTEVSQITIYTTDDFIFKVDDIYVRKTNMYSTEGTIRYRYQTSAEVVFYSIFYDATVPDGTSLSVRYKTSSSLDLLSRSAYSIPISSGNVFALPGSAIEIEVYMTSNSDKSISPSLTSIELRMMVDADFTGFVIDTEDEWNRGTLTNVSLQDGDVSGKTDVVMSSPINVGGRYFLKSNSVSEINDENIGVYGFSGAFMPISPNQAREWSITSARGFKNAVSVIRKFGKTYLIADCYNNRVLEVDSGGNLIKGVGSTYSIDSTFYPLSSVYNSSSKTLSIVFTKPAIVSDITKISFYTGSSKISLTADCSISATRKAEGKILDILLDDDTSVRLVGISDGLSVNFDDGAFTESISVREGMSSIGNSIFSAKVGLTCFVGNFSYIDNIRHPVFVNELESGNWLIANSSIFYSAIDSAKEESKTVSDLVEIDPDDPADTDNKLISTSIKFSDFTLAGAVEYESNKFMVSGIQESSSTLEGITGSELLAQYNPPPESVKFRAAAIDALKNYIGVVVVIDKVNNKTQLFYKSPDGLYPTDISEFSNGDSLISESSFADASGRLTRLDSYGNITWMWGSGTFNIINDAKVLNDDNIVVSV